ncbi:aldose 1-epimerase [Aequitasia blattaphilus]|uniref:Aldose 1-epimerase n=1 Tax=Aequitasia blattaphilus TaxID=2949332 RepID=A0ABT1E7E5_9FIRM|nr:aldose epimerase family protein [Aequitasia blattaphilus]MCP1101753.1 galactose mutarotase [Aequitasia blattaphilus]MCR8614393.1 galactose mutarotase [Aequitasia blattaphilus]
MITLKNQHGLEVTLSEFGGTLVNLLVPDGNGKKIDVVLGYDSDAEYEKGGTFFGAIVGRVANRIAGGKFSLNQKEYTLDQNDHENNLHSGMNFYSKRKWNVKEADENRVTFTLFSPDKDQGYPGNVEISVTYELTPENELLISYGAAPDEDTLINMTNHSYFNLSGHDGGSVLEQKVWIDADGFTPTNEDLIPTGEIRSVENTPMDFRKEKKIGKEINEDYEPLNIAGGYDHNWVLNGSGYRKVAYLYAEDTNVKMEVYTDLPGMQFYTGNFIEKENGKNGAVYKKRHGLCFETQYFPDAVNQEAFQSPITKKGATYQTKTGYKFYF